MKQLQACLATLASSLLIASVTSLRVQGPRWADCSSQASPVGCCPAHPWLCIGQFASWVEATGDLQHWLAELEGGMSALHAWPKHNKHSCVLGNVCVRNHAYLAALSCHRLDTRDSMRLTMTARGCTWPCSKRACLQASQNTDWTPLTEWQQNICNSGPAASPHTLCRHGHSHAGDEHRPGASPVRFSFGRDRTRGHTHLRHLFRPRGWAGARHPSAGDHPGQAARYASALTRMLAFQWPDVHRGARQPVTIRMARVQGLHMLLRVCTHLLRHGAAGPCVLANTEQRSET